jgi:phosphatidylserine decarboxylase
MSKFDYPILAKEGRVHLIVALLTGIFATAMIGWWSIIVWLLVLFVFQFFRDPKRKISDQPGAVVAPASGKIVSIGEEDNPYLENVRSLKVSIFMNVFSVHSNLVPVSGVVKRCWYHEGKFFNAALDKASTENERNAVWIRTEAEEDVVFVQIAGLVARRILCYIKSGDKVETGQRYGFIRFGSRVDLYLPVGTQLAVTLGQWVASGNNIVANLPR